MNLLRQIGGEVVRIAKITSGDEQRSDHTDEARGFVHIRTSGLVAAITAETGLGDRTLHDLIKC